MFIEMTKDAWQKLKEKMDEKGYPYETSDCTVEGDSCTHVHIEFGSLGTEKVREIAAYADAAYAEVAAVSLAEAKEAAAREAYAEEEMEPKETRRREWDDRYHGVLGEAAGFMTGKNTEETIESR